MKIAIVSKADETAGGASRVAADLTRELRVAGVEVSHFVAWAGKQARDSVKFAYGGPVARRATISLGKIARRLGFSETMPFELFRTVSQLKDYDLVHFHDTSSAFSPWTLRSIAKRSKVAWTFHDCSPFTGGCIYPQMAACERYKSGCGSCPLRGQWPLDGLLDTTKLAHASRARLHRDGNIGYITPSLWMADIAYASGLVPRKPTVISNMVDTSVFAPIGNRVALRRRLGISGDGPVFAMSAGNVSDPRKNIRSTLESLRVVAENGEKPTAVIIGNPDPHLGRELHGMDIACTGFVSDRRHLAEWLSASDVFISTSLADNQPLAIMEAMACGTPVYGWPVGGVPEMVANGLCGKTFTSMSPTELGRTLCDDYRSGQLAAMRPKTRDVATSSFSADKFLSDHLSFYENMLSNG